MNGWDNFGDYWVWLDGGSGARQIFHVRRQTDGFVIPGNGQEPFEFSADQVEALGFWFLEQAMAMREEEVERQP